MKIHPNESLRRGPARGGFTLVEMLITLVTMTMVIGAAMGAYLYALRIVQFTKPKLGASDEARQAVSLLTEEIRGARMIRIGSGTANSFTEVGPFNPQVGSAIRLHPTTNYNNYVQYFWSSNATGGRLMRTVNGTTATYVVANCVSNEMVFRSEDHLGNTLMNNRNNRVISMDLRFYQIQFPATPVGPGQYYDFYQLRTKITRRTLQ